MAMNFRRLLFDVGLTGLLIAAYIYGTLYFYSTSATSGQPQQSAGFLIFFSLLPAGILVLLSLIERLVPPAGSRSRASCSASCR